MTFSVGVNVVFMYCRCYNWKGWQNNNPQSHQPDFLDKDTDMTTVFSINLWTESQLYKWLKCQTDATLALTLVSSDSSSTTASFSHHCGVCNWPLYLSQDPWHTAGNYWGSLWGCRATPPQHICVHELQINSALWPRVGYFFKVMPFNVTFFQEGVFCFQFRLIITSLVPSE